MIALWNAQERAHVTKNEGLYRSIDTGTLLLEQLYALDSLRCGCSPFYWTKGERTIRRVELFLPRQTHFPLFRFTAAPLGGPWMFFDGAAEACADINEYETTTWVKPRFVFQQIDGIKANWGPDLDTGFYSTLVTTWEWPVCITTQPGGLAVWGPSTGGYPIHDGGIPVTPGPGTTRVT